MLIIFDDVQYTGVWSLYVGDSSGSIDVWRKGTTGISADEYTSAFMGHLDKYNRWENVHRYNSSLIN